MAGLVIALALWLSGCVSFIGGREQSRHLAAAAQDLVEIAEAREGEVDWLGLRDPAGVQTEETKVLDDYLLSALMKAKVAVGLVDTTGKRWRDEELVGLKQGGRAALALGGRLEADDPWMYVRMFLVERASGELVAVRTARVLEQDVRHEVASRQLGTGKSYGPVEVDLHLIAKREEGGVYQIVELTEGVQLQQGDQMQLRFKLSRDAEVHAFLCRSDGALETVFDEQFVYSDIVQYGPGENNWITFNEIDQVYTLYFLAGPQLLAENAAPFYEQFATLVREGQIDRFTGLELLDQALIEFLQRPEPIAVLRGDEDIPLGRPETIVYDDGSTLSSQAEILTGTPVLVRALSFSVQ
ncbi:MAG: hypothetical protein OXI72_07110 [Gemmatimonadota bacterium]|nr:hypothetical protein [Gemmatimonadota bacterium]